MSETPPTEEHLDALWASGKFPEALELSQPLAESRPQDAALREKIALLAIDYARQDPEENQITIALGWLAQALDIEPDRITSLELRANLLIVMAHQGSSLGLDPKRLFQQAQVDFLRLVTLTMESDHEKRPTWILEAARASFLVERNRSEEGPDFTLSANLYALANGEDFDSSDWFFRGMANLELGEKAGDEDRLRIAGACFLRSIEENNFQKEGRYFAANAFLQLDEPSDEEFNHAALMVKELAEMPSKEFLIDALKERLILKAKLTNRPEPEI